MIDRECPVCGTVYRANPTRLKHGRQTTCSRQCSYPSQERTLEKYARKMSFLSQQGVPVIEVWEMDFTENPEDAVRVALGL